MAKPNLKSLRLLLKDISNGRVHITKSGHVFVDGQEVGTEHKGYKVFGFRYKGKGRQYYIAVHRAVWIAFNGLILNKKLQINHKNGNKLDNRLRNLELVTSSVNTKHAHDTGLADNGIGESARNVKLTDSLVIGLRMLYKFKPFSLSLLAQKLNLHSETIRYALVGKTFSHLPNKVKIVNQSCKLTPSDRRKIFSMYSRGLPVSKLAKKFNVSEGSVYYTIKQVGNNVR